MLQRPVGVAVDPAGNLYIADSQGNRVRKVTPAGIITTVAGTGWPDSTGDGGPAAKADLNHPVALAADRENLYIAERGSNVIRKVVLATGMITTIAGNGDWEAAGDDGPATRAAFDPISISLDGQGNLYIADFSNDRVRKVVLATNIISTAAGIGNAGYTGDTGPATGATLNGPMSIAVDPAGNIYIADTYNNAVRKVSAADGRISTYAGNGDLDLYGDGGPANRAAVPMPNALAMDPTGTQLYIMGLGLIRKVDLATNTISAVGGSLDFGYRGDGGPVSGAVFSITYDLRFAPNGDYYIADTGNYRVRKVSNGTITTVAGSDTKDGVPATSALLNSPSGLGFARSGDLIIADTYSHRLRKVAADGAISTIWGTGFPGSTAGRINMPQGITVDPQGALVFCDTGNDRILRVATGNSVTTLAGTKAGFAGDGGYATAAQLSQPWDVEFDSQGNAFIADFGNLRVRKIDAKSGFITTIGGNGRLGAGGANGPATQMGMMPAGVATDAAGNVFVADMYNDRILRIDASTGIGTIVAGTGSSGFSGDGGPATRAQLLRPTCVRFDAGGNMFICDTGNAAVRKVTPSGTISTIAGNGAFEFDKESGPALSAAVVPVDIAFAPNGTVFVMDPINNRVRKLTPQSASAVAPAAGSGQKGDPGAQIPVSVKVSDPTGVAVAGTVVTFTVTSGSATLSSASAVTAADGIASVTVTLGHTPGPVLITASIPGVPAVTLSLTVNTVVTTPLPEISAGGVAGAGLSVPVQRAVSTNGIVSVFGRNFAAPGTVVEVTAADLVNGRLPTMLANTCVTAGGVRAPSTASTQRRSISRCRL